MNPSDAQPDARTGRSHSLFSNINDDHLHGIDNFLDHTFDLMDVSQHRGDSIDDLLDEALLMMMETDSESDSDSDAPKWGGSRPGRAPNVRRDFEGAYERVVGDYFNGPRSKYDETHFTRRWMLKRENFNKVRDAVIGKGSFVHAKNATQGLQIHPLCRLLACLRILVQGCSADAVDDYLQIGESTANEAVLEFAELVVDNFESEYLGYPGEEEVRRILEYNKARGAPGMFGSWDCSHWLWKNCPTVQAGQYKGHKGKTLIQETVVDYDLYCHYHSFGFPGSMNDINVLDRSETVYKFLDFEYSLKAPEEYTINGTIRDWVWFGTDGIYPSWAIFVGPWSRGDENPKHVFFSKKQEGWRKDVERFYSVLAEEIGLLQKPLRNWYVEDISVIVKCGVILHNMNVASRKEQMMRDGIDEDRRWWLEHAYARDFPEIAGAANLVGGRRTLFFLLKESHWRRTGSSELAVSHLP